MMSEKRFTIHKESKYKEDWYDYPFCIKEDGEVVLETIPLSIAEKVRDKLNEQQATIDKLEERDYYNQSERYKILCRAIELTANYIDNSNEEHYDFCALVTEFEKELLDDE